jgi:hypothetical protein
MSDKLVKVYSVHYNRPEFIRWQIMCLNKFLKDTFEYIVINNAREQAMRDQITLTADSLEVSVIHTHSDTPFHLAGKHHADSLNSVWKSHMIKDKGCYVMFMDGDCFLVAPFSVNEYMAGDVTFGGSKQQRDHIYHYITPVIVMANIDLLPEPEIINWEGIGINNTRLDTGGGLHLYLEKYPEVKAKIKAMHNTWHIKPENKNMHCLPDSLVAEYDPEYHLEFFGNEFLHYCRSSNWDHQAAAHHQAKSDFVGKFINNAIQAAYDNPLLSGKFGEKAKEHNFQIPIDTYFGWGKWS